jgi:hypothetical protein
MKIKTRQEMKKSVYNQGLLLLLPLLLISVTGTAQEVTKEFNEKYSAGASTTLQINNRYGDVTIDSWDQKEVIIDVKVTVELPNRDKAQKLLDYINVEFSQDGDVITAKTVINDRFSFSGWGGKKRFSIDYNVKMPVQASLALVNRYGNSELDELQGLAQFDIRYGNINIGKLTRGNEKPLNRISLSYGKGSVDEAGWLDLVIRYTGDVNITSSRAILLDSRYSKLRIGETSSLVGESKYDNLRIGTINNLVLENGYTDTNIETLTSKLEYEGSYGNFTVTRIPSGFESIDVNTRYMGVNLGIDSEANYNLEAKVSYGDLRYDEDNFVNKRRIIQNTSKEIAGVVGSSESPRANVNVSSSYGTVRLH